MKKSTLLLAFLFSLFISNRIAAQTTITCDSVLQTSTCAGGNVIIPFSITGTFPFGNIFTAQFSDGFGNFGSPVAIGTTLFTINGQGIIFGTIPANANFGFFYRVRIVSSNPADTSNNSPNTLIVTQVAQLNTIIPNPGDSACPGDTITLLAANIANSYSWSTGDTTQSIQVTTSGIYTVTTTDFLMCQSSTSDTVVFDISACTGISENYLSEQTELFPNPSNGNVHLKFHEVYSGNANLTMFNSIGEKSFSKTISISNGTESLLDISNLAPGIYFLVIESDGMRAAKKLIVE